MPKLEFLTTANNSRTFKHPRIITLEGICYHSDLPSRHAFSYECYS